MSFQIGTYSAMEINSKSSKWPLNNFFYSNLASTWWCCTMHIY